MARKEQHPNSLKSLTPFSKTYQPANPGRKPSKLKKYFKENSISSHDISNLLKNTVFSGATEKDLRGQLKNQDIPILIRLFIRALLEDLKSGKLINVETMLTRVFGQPKQSIETAKKPFDIRDIDPADRKMLINELIEKKIKAKEENNIESD